MTDRKSIQERRDALEEKERAARYEFDLYGDDRTRGRWERARDLREVYDLAIRGLDGQSAAEELVRKILRRRVDGAVGRVRDDGATGKSAWTADEVTSLLLSVEF